MSEFVTPPPLERGDRVAVVAPSSGGAAAAPDVLRLGLRRLREEFDLEPVVYPTAERDSTYLYDHPEERARDVHEAFRDPEIRGVVATIGGDDQIRMLRHLDAELLCDNPTRFYGMSDNTNLALFLWNRGIVSFYGAQLLNQLATPGGLPDYTRRYAERAFFEESLGELEPAAEFTDYVVEWGEPDYAEIEPPYYESGGRTWRRADRFAEGRVWGGCLEIVEWQLMADRYLPAPERLDGAVLALETSEDLPSADRVRWLLTCMGERGLLQRFDAVLVGRAQAQNRHARPSAEERAAHRRAQREAVVGMLREYNPDAPAVFDLEFGHTNPTAPIPVGGRVRVDGPNRRIMFE